MFRDTGFGLPVTPSPEPSSQSSVGEDTPPSSQQSTQSPPPSANPMGRSVSLGHLQLDKMAISSPSSKSGQASTSKAKEVEFPLAKPSEQAKQLFKEDDLRALKEMFEHHAERLLIAALNRAEGDRWAATNEILTKYPLEFEFASPARKNEKGPGIVKTEERSASSVRHVNGIVPRLKLRLRNGPPAVAAKSEARTESPESTPSKPTTSPSSYQPTIGSSPPFEEDSEGDDEADIDMDGTDSDEEVDVKDEPDDSLDVKAEELHAIFPGTDLEDCKRILQCADNNLVEAVEMMEEERGDDLFNDVIMSEASERVSNTTPGPLKLSPSPGRSTPSFTSGGTGKKRIAENLEDRPVKKSKSLDGVKKPGTGLSQAGEWVSEYFGEYGDVRLVFEDGEHPCMFTKKLLSKHFQKLERFFASEVKLDDRYTIDNQSQETFNLLLQWAVTRHIQVDPAKHQTKASEITAILKMFNMAIEMDMKELAALEGSIVKILTEILTEERTALKEEHIQFAYDNFVAGHLIKDVFVKAAVRAKIEFRRDVRDQGMSQQQDIRTHMLLDGARKAAWEGNSFVFASAEKEFEEFEVALLRAASRTWEARDPQKKKLGSRWWWGSFLIDPLTEESFFL